MLTIHEMVVFSIIWRDCQKKPDIASRSASEIADPTFDKNVANKAVDKLLDHGYVSRDTCGYTVTQSGVDAFYSTYKTLAGLMPNFKSLLYEDDDISLINLAT